MSRTTDGAVSVSRATDSVSMSRIGKTRADAKARAALHGGDRGGHDPAKPKYRVLDPDEMNKDRTPQPLHKQDKETSGRGTHRRPGPGDRRSSQVPDGGSTSVRTTQSAEERSMSHAEGSNSSSEQVSASTPDELTGTGFDDSTSESMSGFDRSSVMQTATNTGRYGSEPSVAETRTERDESRHRTSDGGGGGAPSPAKEVGLKLKLASVEPTLAVLDRYTGRKPPPKEWTGNAIGEWRKGEVVITLTETPVMFIFNKQDEIVPADEANQAAAELVTRRNAQYEQVLKDKRENTSGGKYTNKGTLTLNEPCTSDGVDVQAPATSHSPRVQVTPYDLHDEMLRANEEDQDHEEDAKAEGGDGGDGGRDEDAQARGDVAEEPEQEDGEGGADDGGAGGAAGAASAHARKSASWMAAPSLLETVLIVERCIVMNNYEEKQLQYRGIQMENITDHLATTRAAKQPSPTNEAKRRRDYSSILQSDEQEAQDEEKKRAEEERQRRLAVQQEQERAGGKAGSKTSVLWTFGADFTRGKNVTCLAWNRQNTDILAAGYGEYGVPGVDTTSKSYGGMVACWSVQNPCYPERIIHMESEAGVSALHFSRQHPNLLAVGATDGTLALYDVRAHGNSPALKTTVSTGQHTGTIWEVRWVDKGQDRGETLISISADGHVMEWSIKKGLERTADLMKLKRGSNFNEGHSAAIPSKGGQPKEALLARQSGGMCFDINPVEPLTYIVGTEDGTLHKCSKSQNESYVYTYRPHGEPVYRVRWSPFCPDYFLTGSADWTSRLYHADRSPDPLAVYDSNQQDAVQDLCWSPTRANIFATATAAGQVDVWDVADPNKWVASLPLGKQLNCLLFAEQESPVLACGDATGEVSVVKLHGEQFERMGLSDLEQRERFQAVTKALAT